MTSKPPRTLAIYAATGCRACEHVLLDIQYQIQAVTPWSEIVFWPYVLGSDLAALNRHHRIDAALFIGAIGTSSDRKAALILREKAQILLACGACAAFGGLPGLCNLAGKSSEDPDAENQEIHPDASGSTHFLPPVESSVSSLYQVVHVDYAVPGCPPTPALLWSALQAVICGPAAGSRLTYALARLPENISRSIAAGVLPPSGSVFAGKKAVCATCCRGKEEKRFSTLKRTHEKYEATGRCLLEQGLLCLGVATREGCGGLCTAAGLPCRGCFGKPEAVYDPGAKMVSTIGSTFDSQQPEEIESLADAMVDLTGTFYRYTFASQCAMASKTE